MSQSQRQPQPSQTQTQTEEERPPEAPQRTLRLVGDDSRQGRHVQWTEETVDNEHMNLKKSKICCIFHPKKEFDESSDESDYSSSSSSSSSSDDDDDVDCNCRHKHHHKRRPNAYERMPKIDR